MARANPTNSRLVYSTETGRTCPAGNRNQDRCRCAKPAAAPAGDGIVRVGRSTKGRKGKCVTAVSGIPQDGVGLKRLARILKQKTGSGGTVKSGAIEIQGDHRDVLMAELRRMGYTVKRSGG